MRRADTSERQNEELARRMGGRESVLDGEQGWEQAAERGRALLSGS